MNPVKLNVLELCEYADALGADAADIIRSVVKARGQREQVAPAG